MPDCQINQDESPTTRGSIHKLASLVAARGVGVLIQLAINIVIARLFGATGIGIYQLYQSWMVSIADGAGMGLPVTTMREVSRKRATGQEHEGRVLVVNTLVLTALVFTVLAILGLLLVKFLNTSFPGTFNYISFLSYSLVGATLFAVFRIVMETFKAEGRPLLATMGESLFLPIVFCCIAIISFFLLDSLGEQVIIVAHIVTLALLTTVVLTVWLRGKETSLHPGTGINVHQVLQPDSLHIWANVLVNSTLLYFPFFLLPFLAAADVIGIFSVNYRIVAVSTTLLVVLSAWYGPRIAAAQANKNHKTIRHELAQARYVATALYLPFLMLCLIFGEQILSLFGSEFAGSSQLLAILAFGQLVNAMTGVPGLHLNMTGNGRIELNMSIMSILVGILACVFGNHFFGITGFAIGYSMAIVVKNLGSCIYSIRYSINPPSLQDARIEPSLHLLSLNSRT